MTERESWILDNLENNPGLTVEQNAAMIEPGLESATEDFKKTVYAEVKGRWRRSVLRTGRVSGRRS